MFHLFSNLLRFADPAKRVSCAGPEVIAIPGKQLVTGFQASFARMRETCSRYIGDKSFTCISVTPQRASASNDRKRIEDDFAKYHFGGIKTAKRQLIQMYGSELRAAGSRNTTNKELL
jgi:hypothetical protein